MVSKYDEKGVTLIEAGFILILFCFIFIFSVQYIHLTLVVSRSLSLGQILNTVGNQIELIVKSGECECQSANSICSQCLTNAVLDSDEIKKLNLVSSLKVALRSLNTKNGIGVLIYPDETITKEGSYYINLDEIYFTIAGTREKSVIIYEDSSIMTPSKISFVIDNITDNNKKILNLSDFGIETTGPRQSIAGIYFEIT